MEELDKALAYISLQRHEGDNRTRIDCVLV